MYEIPVAPSPDLSYEEMGKAFLTELGEAFF
jgi:hypothetical protein